MMGQRGRYFEMRCAERPVVVMTMIAEAIDLKEASTAAMAVVWVLSEHVTTCGTNNRYKFFLLNLPRNLALTFPTIHNRFNSLSF